MSNIQFHGEDAPPSVEVTFAMGNDQEVKRGLVFRKRGTVEEENAIQTELVKQRCLEHRATLSRLRDGMVDTGDLVFENIPNVRASKLRTSLVNCGYVLTDALYFIGKGGGVSVRLFFTKQAPGEELKTMDLTRPITDYLRMLANKTFSYLWVYDNRKAGNDNATITLTGASWSPGDEEYKEPDHELIVKDGQLLVPAIPVAVGEPETEKTSEAGSTALSEKIAQTQNQLMGVVTGMMVGTKELDLTDQEVEAFCDATKNGEDLWMDFRERQGSPETSDDYSFIDFMVEVLNEAGHSVTARTH